MTVQIYRVNTKTGKRVASPAWHGPSEQAEARVKELNDGRTEHQRVEIGYRAFPFPNVKGFRITNVPPEAFWGRKII